MNKRWQHTPDWEWFLVYQGCIYRIVASEDLDCWILVRKREYMPYSPPTYHSSIDEIDELIFRGVKQ